ncbi:unnamed protein product, partial [Amoebophrya sp. A120]|eukprot:GSA120T00025878001.1
MVIKGYKYILCSDFQAGNCRKKNCRLLHASPAIYPEQRDIEAYDQYHTKT